MSNPFRYFNSSPEVIRLVVMLYVRYPLSLSSRLVVIEGADHALVWSRPEALVDAVEEFHGT
jgi:pimeloyl-ACP methyl ester carboxylesterase